MWLSASLSKLQPLRNLPCVINIINNTMQKINSTLLVWAGGVASTADDMSHFCDDTFGGKKTPPYPNFEMAIVGFNGRYG